MNDVIKNEQLKQLAGDELYENFGLFVSAIRAELDMAEYSDCHSPEEVICFEDRYCMVDVYKNSVGLTVLHFNERAGGNFCGEFLYNEHDNEWADTEGGVFWSLTKGFFEDELDNWLDSEEETSLD